MESSRTVVRVVAFMILAALFIVQYVLSPLKTVFLALGEYIHTSSYILLIELFWVNRGLKGISVKTQVCFLFVHWLRYVDSLLLHHSNKSIWMLKIFYLTSSSLVVLSLICLRRTYEREKDTCAMMVLLVTSVVLGSLNAFVDTRWEDSIFTYFWVISHYLQGFAMLPQFIFCYRDPENDDKLLLSYILVLGGYRIMYAFNWIERHIREHFFYVSGPLGLLILVIFLSDFLLYKIRKRSFISSWVLRIDDRVDELQQPLLNAFYNMNYERLPPYSLSSSVSGGEGEGRNMRVSFPSQPCCPPHHLPSRIEPIEISLHVLDANVGSGRGGRGEEEEEEEGGGGGRKAANTTATAAAAEAEAS